jgi:hypothetical protein
MSVAINRIKAKAEALADIRKLMKEIEDISRQKLANLQVQKDTLSALLIADFNKEGLTSIKTEDGDTYSKSVRKGIEVTSEAHAFAWCLDNRAVSINKTLVKQKLEPIMKAGKPLPDGFEYKEVEFISCRSAKVKETEPEAKK